MNTELLIGSVIILSVIAFILLVYIIYLNKIDDIDKSTVIIFRPDEYKRAEKKLKEIKVDDVRKIEITIYKRRNFR